MVFSGASKLVNSVKSEGIVQTAMKVCRYTARAFCGHDSGYRPFNLDFGRHSVSQDVLNITRSMRGGELRPAIIVQGVSVRSGTGFVSPLLGLHPDLHKHPNDVWEIPFLRNADHLLRFRDDFFNSYCYNVGRIGENDFLALFGSSFITYMMSFADPNKRIILTHPGVQFLEYFFTFFPHKYLLLLMRDGRDVVASAQKTWQNRPFAGDCRRWNDHARVLLRFCEFYKNRGQFWMGRYEDAYTDCEGFVNEACKHFDLDPSKYPFDKARDLPIQGSSTFEEVQQGNWVSKPKSKDFNPIGRWISWTPQQKEIFKEIAGQTLIDAGYSNDFSW